MLEKFPFTLPAGHCWPSMHFFLCEIHLDQETKPYYKDNLSAAAHMSHVPYNEGKTKTYSVLFFLV